LVKSYLINLAALERRKMSLYEAIFLTLKQWWVPLALLAVFFIVYFGITEWARRADEKTKVSSAAEEKS
jgi:hypothetical protein